MIKHFGDGHYISVANEYEYPKEYSTCKLCGLNGSQIHYSKELELALEEGGEYYYRASW